MPAAHYFDIPAMLQRTQLWHARTLLEARPPAERGISTGFAALDAALPSQGWPAGQLCELICTQGNSGEWSLMQPALLLQLGLTSSAAAKKPAQLVVINPPHQPYLPAWQASGFAASSVLKIDTTLLAQSQSRACWAAEQALHCADVAAVVAWLPRVSSDALRRLQLAASQSKVLLFVVRPLVARDQSSPASLRLVLSRADALHSDVEIFKCRGSAAHTNIRIELLSPSLRALLQARKRRMQAAPLIQKITQISPVFRMTPRSQTIELSPSSLLFGNERAAEGPAMNAKAHHGLDCTTTLNLSPATKLTSTKLSTTALKTAPTTTTIIGFDRTLKRAARHARSR